MNIRRLFTVGLLLAPLSLGVVSLSSVGCSSSDDSSDTSLEGTYKGTFNGDDTGPVTMTISGTKLDVVATVSGTPYPGSGTVAAGGAASVGLGVGGAVVVTFDGSFSGGKGSGNWKSSTGTKGTWSVSK